MFKSLAAALGLLSLAAAQSAVPEQSGAGGGSDNGCDACYIVANVAGVAFGTETLTATATQNIIVGRNGSFTTTSVVFDVNSFTAASGQAQQPGGNSGAQTAYNTDGTTVVLGGVTLTSPTAYNVFTALTVTSRVSSNGACITQIGTVSTVSPAFSVAIPASVNQANFASFQYVAEQSFLAHIGSQQCVPASEVYSQTSQIPVVVTTTTATSTAIASLRPTQPTIGTSATAPTAASTTAPAGTTIAFLSTGAPIISSAINTSYVGPYPTIQSAGANRQSLFGSVFAGAMALLAGLAA